MEYFIHLVTFSLFWKLSSSVQCFKCLSSRSLYDPHIPLCAYFNASDVFHTDCPYSTICYKKETTYDFGNGPTKYVERGCANQLLSGDQVRGKDHKWVTVKRIHEIYNETCTEDTNDEARITRTKYCYCRGDFCNGASNLRNIFPITISALIYYLWHTT